MKKRYLAVALAALAVSVAAASQAAAGIYTTTDNAPRAKPCNVLKGCGLAPGQTITAPPRAPKVCNPYRLSDPCAPQAPPGSTITNPDRPTVPCGGATPCGPSVTAEPVTLLASVTPESTTSSSRVSVPDPPSGLSRTSIPCGGATSCTPGPLTAAPASTAACVSSDQSKNVVALLCADRTVVAPGEYVTLTATILVGGVPSTTADCFLWGSTDKSQVWTSGWKHVTSNGTCTYQARIALGAPETVDYYVSTGSYPNVTQTPGHGLAVAYS